MSTETRAWLACLAVVAALVVVVPALTQEPEPRPTQRVPEPSAAQGSTSDSDAQLVAAFDRSLAIARDLSARGALAPVARGGSANEVAGRGRAANGAARVFGVDGRASAAPRPPRTDRVTLETFAADALLRGIYHGESYRAAVLNDELVQEGDELAPKLFVASIGERHVLLELDGEEARLDLPGTRAPETNPSGTNEPSGANEPSGMNEPSGINEKGPSAATRGEEEP